MFIIGIAGGSGSGKTTVAKKISENFSENAVSMICQDYYYRDNSHIPIEKRKEINFDDPAAIEFDLLIDHVNQLREGKAIEMPTYSYKECIRLPETIPAKPTEVLIVEGIFVLTHPVLRSLMDVKVYVDAEADNRLIRILKRDQEERGRGFYDVINHYKEFVQPMHNLHIEPSKGFADLIIPGGGKNLIAIDVLRSQICQNIYS